ncbi:Uncharacterised protein [uncultured archaeon]|nr:Uncharacterised protein [uncultured archaeon]
MQKFQWYILSGVSFLMVFIFGALANNRKNICDTVMPMLQQVCLERRTTYILIAFILLILALVFLVFGLFQKSKK